MPTDPTVHLSDEMLSAYIDGALTPEDRARADRHLAACADCQERLDYAMLAISVLSELPQRNPSRSFQISPATSPTPASSIARRNWLPEWLLPGLPALRAATAAVALLLIVVTVADLRQVDRTVETPVAREAPAPLPAADPQGGDSASGAAAETDADAETTAAEGFPGAAEPTEPGSAPQPDLQAADAPAAEAPAAPADGGTGTIEQVPTERQGRNGPSRLRIAEVGLAILLAWLVVTWVAAREAAKRRRSP